MRSCCHGASAVPCRSAASACSVRDGVRRCTARSVRRRAWPPARCRSATDWRVPVRSESRGDEPEDEKRQHGRGRHEQREPAADAHHSECLPATPDAIAAATRRCRGPGSCGIMKRRRTARDGLAPREEHRRRIVDEQALEVANGAHATLRGPAARRMRQERCVGGDVAGADPRLGFVR